VASRSKKVGGQEVAVFDSQMQISDRGDYRFSKV